MVGAVLKQHAYVIVKRLRSRNGIVGSAILATRQALADGHDSALIFSRLARDDPIDPWRLGFRKPGAWDIQEEAARGTNA